MSPELSLVIPIRNESPNIDALYVEMTEALERWGRSYEVIAIDDGSTDDSFERLARCQARDPRWRIIRFRRNFGQTAAFSAGFRHARGRLIATADGDLQNDPRDLPDMIRRVEEGMRHRLRMAQGSQGPLADPAASVGACQQADLMVDRREASRLRLLAQSLPGRGRKAAEALRRDAPVSSGDRERDGRQDRRGGRQPSRTKTRRVELRIVADVPRRPRSADGEVPPQLLDPPAADVRAHWRADGIAWIRDCGISVVRASFRPRIDRQPSAAPARRAADFLGHPTRHDGAARGDHGAHLPRVAGQAHIRDS